MPFKPKDTRRKVNSVYKTLYLSQTLVDEINKLASQSETSFNNVVVSMIEYCLAERGDENSEK